MISERHNQLILTANQRGKPLTVTTFSYLPNAQTYIDKILGVYLEDLGLGFLFDQLSYCLRELAVNAKKANTKRLYFQQRGLNLTDPADYSHGMESFKHDTLNNQHFYLELLKKHNLYIKLEFLRYQENCTIAIRNNVPILDAELARVREKIDKAGRYSSLEDAFSEVLDESEGAGLGILVMMLMLRKVGFSGDFFQIYTLGGETVARIILPLTVD